MVSLNMVFAIPQNQCYPGTLCVSNFFHSQYSNELALDSPESNVRDFPEFSHLEIPSHSFGLSQWSNLVLEALFN
jgi:hypothetical protein